MKMNRSILWLFTLVLLSSCSIFSKQNPVTYKMYTHEQPYDLVFLKAFETIDSDNDWIFSSTRKELGTIDIRNMNYDNWFGIDRQYARFLVKHVSETETSIEIDPANTSCKENACIRLLERINEALSMLPAHPKKETPPAEETQEVSPPPAT